MYSPETQVEIQLLRQKVRDKTATQGDMKRAIELLRQGRAVAAEASAKATKTKATATAKKKINSEDLLSELDGL